MSGRQAAEPVLSGQGCGHGEDPGCVGHPAQDGQLLHAARGLDDPGHHLTRLASVSSAQVFMSER